MRLSKKATEFQKKEMSKMYRGKEIFKPLNTGWIDEHVACVREWVANTFFYRRGGTTIMIDAGYNYDRLAEKMGWLGIDPASIRHILITHQDTDNVGAVESDSPGLFRGVTLYVGETENRYLTGDTIWLGADGSYNFISALAEDNKLAARRISCASTPSPPADRTVTADIKNGR